MVTVRLQFVNITIECVGVTVEAQEVCLSVSGNNYVKVWRKRPLRRRSKGCKDGPQISAIFTVFLKITHLQHMFGLKFLPKNMLVERNNTVAPENLS